MSTEYTALLDHITFDSAFVAKDYPYGRKLRCKMKFWIETKVGYGQRLVTQSTNPKSKSVIEEWNKPHKGTYSAILTMYLDERGYVACDPLSMYCGEEKLNSYVERFGEDSFKNKYREEMLRIIRASNKSMANRFAAIAPVERCPTGYTKDAHEINLCNCAHNKGEI